MSPAFFGPPGEQLLGVHHPPRGTARGVGVVLCPPAPQEYARSHWAFRKLAEQLAKSGFDVLRFDYRGTGDSSGELADTSPQTWVEDIRRAVKELKDVTGLRRVSAVGFRLGALLLAQAASEGVVLESLVLWEPVVNAANWMEQLRLIERQLNREMSRPPKERRESVLGFVLSARQLDQWEALELTTVPPWTAKTAVVSSTPSAHLDRLERALTNRRQPVTFHRLTSAAGDAKTGALLGNEALDQIVAVLGGRP